MSCVQLSEGGFQVVYPLGLWSRSSGVVKFKSYMDMASTLFTFTFTWPYACHTMHMPPMSSGRRTR